MLVALFLWLSCSGCFIIDEDFVIHAQDYSGDEIKLNGYYDIYCFYENGVVYNGSLRASSLEGIDAKIKNGLYADKKVNWGIFAIDDTIVRVEFIRYYGGLQGLSHTWLGRFPNDSTISFSSELITNQDPKSYWQYNVTSDYRVEYYFKACDYKPDYGSFRP